MNMDLVQKSVKKDSPWCLTQAAMGYDSYKWTTNFKWEATDKGL